MLKATKCDTSENNLAMNISGTLKDKIREKFWTLNKEKHLVL